MVLKVTVEPLQSVVHAMSCYVFDSQKVAFQSLMI